MSRSFDQLKHYKDECVRLMNLIEETSGQTMSEINASLESKFWQAHDFENVPMLRQISKRLEEVYTNLTMN
jgi:hypothetical protein